MWSASHKDPSGSMWSLRRPRGRREIWERPGQRDAAWHGGRGDGNEEGKNRLDGTGWLTACGRWAEGGIKGDQVSGLGNCLDESRINREKRIGGMEISWGRRMRLVSGMMCPRCQGTCNWVQGSGILLAPS